MQVKGSTAPLVVAATLFIGYVSSASAQTAAFRGNPTVTKPASSVIDHRAAGKVAYTSVQYLAFPEVPKARLQTTGPPYSGSYYQTPASIACVYGLTTAVSGCNPYTATAVPSGGSKAIAIVDAYDDPNALSDLSVFSTQFGVVAPTSSNFQVVYAPPGGTTSGSCVGSGTEPAVDTTGGWELEEALDIEMAHSMAPNATLYLVEAQSNALSDLYCAVTVASNLVNAAGGGEVSMSWIASEYSTETSVDSLVFATPNVVYFAAAGDYPAVFYPSTSPNVVSVGGTSLGMNLTTGNFTGESAWQLTGGGPSAYEPRPSYQNSISKTVGSYRGTPDVSANADPWTAVWVYDTYQMQGDPPCDLSNGWYCWWEVGGTSVATPLWAGIVNAAGSFSASTSAELTKLYADSRSDFNALTSGSCGWYAGWFASSSWNFCTGLGSPKSYKGK